ncbi:hypothetical protein KIN20_017801 [Parelaphostrongylus tenuis]|uniref:Uncharacterized protein n=1 Tax=Parelaphostrongylus tenuis TaxID=148309 RepID=A0AAD5MIE0_PARTN|nr:hypothetical protein KIN20_017801 [Parelaphostrongylus tenuis]
MSQDVGSNAIVGFVAKNKPNAHVPKIFSFLCRCLLLILPWRSTTMLTLTVKRWTLFFEHFDDINEMKKNSEHLKHEKKVLECVNH